MCTYRRTRTDPRTMTAASRTFGLQRPDYRAIAAYHARLEEKTAVFAG